MLHVFALNFSFVVPEGSGGGDTARTSPTIAVGTGAYKMTEYSPGQRIVLERNPDWNKEDGRPYVDKFILQFGLEPRWACCACEKNEADILGEIFPPAKVRSRCRRTRR